MALYETQRITPISEKPTSPASRKAARMPENDATLNRTSGIHTWAHTFHKDHGLFSDSAVEQIHGLQPHLYTRVFTQ